MLAEADSVMSKQATTATDEERQPGSTNQHPMLTVLLVEHDAESRQRILDHLQQPGIDATSTASGQEAVEASLTKRFDLALIDQTLEDLTWQQVVQLIHGSGNPAEIVLMSPNSSQGRVAAPGTPPNDLQLHQHVQLQKPIVQTELNALLERCLLTARPGSAYSDPVLDEEELSRLQLQFLDSLQAEYLDPLNLAIREHRPEPARAALHKLKGAAGSFGYHQLSSYAGTAESQMRKGTQLDQTQTDINKVFAEAQRLLKLEYE